jgi:cytochrome c oxidase assembly protein subunit 15
MGFNRIHTKQLTAVLIGITFVVIILGGIVRVYDAGESCPDWPTCFGSFGFDISEADQEAWWDDNPDEIDSRGPLHRYTSFEIYTEWFHRVIAGSILGPLVLLNWWLARKEEGITTEVRLASSISVGLIIWQGLLGWLTVKMDNEHWSVALHLASALMFMMSLIWMWLAIARDLREEPDWITFDPILANSWHKRIAWLSLATLLTLFTGVFVATTPGANQACGVGGFPNTWPLCNGELFSKITDIFAQSQLIHRLLVGIVGLALIAASIMIRRESDDGQCGSLLSKWIYLISGMFLLNLSLGGLYVLSAKVDGFEIVYDELLSLFHLMFASITFLLLATVWTSMKVISFYESNPENIE